MYASASFEAILTEVQSSNLNFRLEISPFSAVIHLKKSLLKNHQGESEVPLRLPKFLQLQELLTQNTAFKNKIFDLENTLQSLKDEHDSVFSDNENRVKTLEHELKVIKQTKFEVKDETAIFYKKTEKMKEELILKTEQIQILEASKLAKQGLSCSNDMMKDQCGVAFVPRAELGYSGSDSSP